MIRFLSVAGMVLVASLSFTRAGSIQESRSPRGEQPAQKLRLIATGNEVMSSGRRGGFRIYAASDGTRAEVSYAIFDSVDEAKRQAEQWRKAAKRIIRKKQDKDKAGNVIRETLIATMHEPKSGRTIYMIIKRDGLSSYFIRSLSLRVAASVEDLMGN